MRYGRYVHINITYKRKRVSFALLGPRMVASSRANHREHGFPIRQVVCLSRGGQSTCHHDIMRSYLQVLVPVLRLNASHEVFCEARQARYARKRPASKHVCSPCQAAKISDR